MSFKNKKDSMTYLNTMWPAGVGEGAVHVSVRLLKVTVVADVWVTAS